MRPEPYRLCSAKWLLPLILLLSPGLWAQAGHLVIIGGGQRPPAMMKRIVALAGGENSRFLVVPQASSVPLEVALLQKYQLEKAGAGSVDFILCTRESADHDTSLARLEGVNGIFFSGGDQRRLTAVYAGTRFLERIREIYRQGGVIAGTSAGAAVMSKLMITGDERKYPEEKEPFRTIEADNIVVTEGFGFIDNAIIDQHFVRRKRHNRLLSLVLEHPELPGIGIDESTAILVKPDRSFEVLGENTVIVYDARASRQRQRDQNGNLAATGIAMSILCAGQEFRW